MANNTLASAAIGEAEQQPSVANTAVVPQQTETPAAFDYKPGTSAAGNVQKLTQEGGAYMSQAKQAGEAQAARRGMANTAMAGQTSMGAAIQAAQPLAEADAQRVQEQYKLEATVSSNLQGQYAQTQNDIINQYAISINEIETSGDLTQAQKDAMIKNEIARRNADMAFNKNLYTNLEGYSTDWDVFPV
jgi:hypothetical protein